MLEVGSACPATLSRHIWSYTRLNRDHLRHLTRADPLIRLGFWRIDDPYSLKGAVVLLRASDALRRLRC